jgi:hypothetical protein
LCTSTFGGGGKKEDNRKNSNQPSSMDNKLKEAVKKQGDFTWAYIIIVLIWSAVNKFFKVEDTWLNLILFFILPILFTCKLYVYLWRSPTSWGQKIKQGEKQV